MAYSHSIAIVADQRTAGTSGDAVATTSDTTLTLNTIVTDPDSIVQSLSANKFTLDAGEYEVVLAVVGHDVNQRRATLYNVTDSTTIGTAQARANFFGGSTSIASVRFTLSGTKSIEVRTQNNLANGTMGIGGAMGTEQYTTVMIRQVVDSSAQFLTCTLAEQYGIGVGGGAFNSGARRSRDVNTKLQDLDSIATLNVGGTFDLGAGRYDIIASCNNLFDVGLVKMWLYNVDTASDLCQGINARVSVAVNETAASFLVGTFDLASTTEVQMQMQCATSNPNGFGAASSFDVGNFLYMNIRKYSE
jgi:hypothetical protein